MSTGLRYRFVGVSLASSLGVLTALAALGACSDQGEGDRCQAENGNSDCASGLVCVAGSQKDFNGGVGLANGSPSSDRCCPADRSTATHPACTNPTFSGAGDGGAPSGETGPTPPTPDATADSPADSNVPDGANGRDASADADADTGG